MRRLVRRLFTLCPAASLLVCLGSATLWVRSVFVLDRLMYVDPDWHTSVSGPDAPPQPTRADSRRPAVIGVGSSLGRVGYMTMSHPWMIENPDRAFRWDRERPPTSLYDPTAAMVAGSWLTRFGFLFHRLTLPLAGGGQLVIRTAIVPWWAVVVLTGVAPLARTARGLRERRSRMRTSAGRCPACGYDLRASPERCPECGGVPDAAAA